METLVTMLNLFPAESFLTLEENVQIITFCNKMSKLVPTDCFKLVTQLIKSFDSLSFNMLKDELDCISKKQRDQNLSTINSCISNLETKVVNIKALRRLDLDKAMEKPLKQVVHKAIMVIFKQKLIRH